MADVLGDEMGVGGCAVQAEKDAVTAILEGCPPNWKCCSRRRHETRDFGEELTEMGEEKRGWDGVQVWW